MVARQAALAEVIKRDPDVQSVISTVGGGNAANTVNSGRVFIMLRDKPERKDTRATGDRTTASLDGVGAGHQRVLPACAVDQHRHHADPRPVPVRHALERSRGPARVCAADGRAHAAHSDHPRRQFRSSGARALDGHRHRPRHRLAARPVGRPDPPAALLGLRDPPGLDDLCARRHLPGDPRGRSEIRRHQRGAATHPDPHADRRAGAARYRGQAQRQADLAHRQPHRPASLGDHLLQPGAGHCARRGSDATSRPPPPRSACRLTSPPASRAAPRSSSRRSPTRACCCSPRCW